MVRIEGQLEEQLGAEYRTLTGLIERERTEDKGEQNV